MRIDPAGWPFVLGALVIGLIGAFVLSPTLGYVCLALAAFFLFFFRDPERVATDLPGAVLAPADGRIIVAGASTAAGFAPHQWKQVSIFLSPTDVHVNRLPVSGRVEKVRYHRGRFLPAYRADAGELNEFTEVWIEHEGHMIVVRQIVGILARRIVCRTREGAMVRAGERFGVMKFGSRMDVFLPATAEITVRIGEKVVGAVTVIATLEARGRQA
jgi:phosphatidylserine decarboxylase